MGMNSAPDAPGLFSRLQLRGVELPSRAGVSPMCMYAAEDGVVGDFHVAHLGRFALGGAGLVLMEATAVAPEGRISHHDTGAWGDHHDDGLRRIAAMLSAAGAVPGIQLGHAGRRASVREPWHAGRPLVSADAAEGLAPWQTVGPSAIAAGPGFPTPREMTTGDIAASIDAWAAAARRAAAAGFRVIELHGAHGYLLHSFLSPVSNHRTDAYGGSPENRMRYPLEVVEAVRAAVPDDIALAYRVSAVDGVPGGLELADTVAAARALAEAGVDLVDTSSGGISTDRTTDTRVRRGYAFHADFSRAVRSDAGVATATVGLVVDPAQADALVRAGDADVVLLGREMLDDPNWVHHARRALGEDEYPHWDIRFASALAPRARVLQRLAEAGETPHDRHRARVS